MNNTITIDATTLNNTIAVSPATATSTIDWGNFYTNTYTTTQGRWDSITENIRAVEGAYYEHDLMSDVYDRWLGGRGNRRSRIVADKGYFKEEREECFELPDVEELFK